jgi:hypothetical protein
MTRNKEKVQEEYRIKKAYILTESDTAGQEKEEVNFKVKFC